MTNLPTTRAGSAPIVDEETDALASEPCTCIEEDPRAIEGGHTCESCYARSEQRAARAEAGGLAEPGAARCKRCGYAYLDHAEPHGSCPDW